MAVLPDPGQINRVALQPSTSVARVRTGDVANATIESAEMSRRGAKDLDSSIQTLGRVVVDTARREQDRLVKAQVDTGANQIRDLSTDLAIGEKGYTHTKGGGVLRPDFVKNVGSEYDRRYKELRDKLPTKEAQGLLDQTAAQYRSELIKGATLHSIRESDAYSKQADQASIDSFASYAASQHSDPDVIRGGVEGTRAVVLNMMAKQGVTPETPGGQEIIDAAVLEAVGGVHAAVVLARRSSGDISGAQAYFAENKANMSSEQIAKIEPALKKASAINTGDGIGQQAAALRESGKTATEVQRFIEKNTEPGEARLQAQSVLLEREQAIAKDIRDRTGALYKQLYDDGLTRATRNAIMRSNAYLELPPAAQEDFLRGSDNILKSNDAAFRAQRNDDLYQAKLAQQAKDDAPEARAVLHSYASDPDALARLSDNDILSLSGTLGKANTTKLMAWRNTAKKEGAGAGVNPEFIKAALATVPKGDDRKKHEIELKSAIASALMDWKIAHPGSKPTEDQQRAIALAGQEDWVKLNTVFSNEIMPKYKVQKGGGFPLSFARLYPKMSDIDRVKKYTEEYAPFADNLKSIARKKGQALNDDMIAEVWRLKEKRASRAARPGQPPRSAQAARPAQLSLSDWMNRKTPQETK